MPGRTILPPPGKILGAREGTACLAGWLSQRRQGQPPEHTSPPTARHEHCPRGEKRPADVIGNAVKVMRIATGEEEEELPDSAKSAAQELGARGGKITGRTNVAGAESRNSEESCGNTLVKITSIQMCTAH